MNRLPGRIFAIVSEGGISMVDVAVEADTMTAMLVETAHSVSHLQAGSPVSVLFKETEVSLGKGLSGGLSLRNRLATVVVGIKKGQLLAEVELDYRGHRLVSIITRRAVERLELVVGESVEALIKANEVMIGAPVNEL